MSGHAVPCPTCGAPHHAECWAENDGCAVTRCASGPKLPYLGPRVAQPVGAASSGRITVEFEEVDDGAPPLPASVVSPVVRAPRTDRPVSGTLRDERSRASRKWVYVAAVVVLLAVVTALVASQSSRTTGSVPGGPAEQASASEKQDAAERTDRLIHRINDRATTIDRDQRTRDKGVAPPASAGTGSVPGASPGPSTGGPPASTVPGGSANGGPDVGGGTPGTAAPNVTPTVDAGSPDATPGTGGTETTPAPGNPTGDLAP